MTTLDLDALQAAAEAATPGPWQWVNPSTDEQRKLGEWRSSLRTVEEFQTHSIGVPLPAFIIEADEICDADGKMDANATFIAAANPATILALIDRLRKAEATKLTCNVDYLRANFTPTYLLANARRIASAGFKRSENWVLAMNIFAVGSKSARAICIEAGIDPDAKEFRRVAAPTSADSEGEKNG